MNNEWLSFLKSNPVNTMGDTSNTLTAITNLTTLEVSGKEAAQFLQGQLTCNILDLTESNSFFTAFCNAKGRTISTLLILKNKDRFLLILPVELLEKVRNKLKMYVLRADVKLEHAIEKYCLIGLNSSTISETENYPDTAFEVSTHSEIAIRLPASQPRFLIITKIDQAKELWTQLIQTYFLTIADAGLWNYLDISAGLAWLDNESSEQYIPQMLNIDKLGGISFNKGCYTGQEIIARTHYLGKAKRELFLAECNVAAIINKDTQIISADSKQNQGKIISLQYFGQSCLMLIVIASSTATLNNLVLDNANQDKIILVDFQ